MIKLAKYLKPFLTGIAVAILLLFLQAICDLNLPNYMSDIVNIGIQQNGIEHASPDVISQEGLKLMLTFMDDNDKNLVEDSYELKELDAQNNKGKAYSSLYPKADAGVYIRKESLEKDVVEKLDVSFGTATWTFINAVQAASNVSGQSSDTPSDIESVDLGKIYEMQPMFDQLPTELIDDARQKAKNNQDTILNQSGIMFTKLFYEELGVDVERIQSGYIINVGLIMLAIAFVGGVATVTVSYISSKIAAGVARNLRKDIFAKVENFSNEEFDQFSTASLITRTTNDVMNIQMLLMMGIRMICYAPIMAIGGILMAVNKAVSMGWIIALACVILLGVILIVVAVVMPKFKSLQKLVDRLNLVARENLSGLMVIRAFNTQNHEKKRFEKANRDLTKTNLFVNRVMVLMMPIMMLIMNGISVLIVWVGAHQISESTMQVGDMMAFIQYAMQIIMSFLMISMIFIFVPRAAVSAERIAETLNTDISIKQPENVKKFNEDKKGYVEFKNVHFRYKGAEEDAIDDITFTAKPGETTAIIGSTGSGKSTIVNLILRLYDVTQGQVLVDGIDVREADLKDLRNRIGYVPQKGILLSGTIDSNLRYGKRDASKEEIERAASIAQASDFISEKSDGFDSIISQGGSNVSGGQKQRLSIARALAKRPEIFIFDDSFSALDFKTDSRLRKALKESTGDSAVIIVAQRVSTIMQAEQILVLNEGKLVGQGTHKELIKNCPEYYEIASSQMTKEELA